MTTPAEPPNSPESELMYQVDTMEWGPTELDEMATLHRFYLYDEESGTFSSHVGDEM